MTTATGSYLKARKQLRAYYRWEDPIILCSYRPFDQRWCYFDTVAMDYPRRELLDHVAWRDNLCLLTSRQQATPGYRHCWVAKDPANDCVVSATSREANHVFPLYLYPNQQLATIFDRMEPSDAPGGRRPNLAPEFVADLSKSLSLRFIPDGCGNLQITFGPEDVFHYVYAVLTSPTYRTRYAEFLKIDFPRLPLTNDPLLFSKLAQLGADLVTLHLHENDNTAASWIQTNKESPLTHPGITFHEGSDDRMVGKFGRNNFQYGRVYLDSSKKDGISYFEGIEEEVWNFQIGGYQVLHKWLYDRRTKGKTVGRTLTDEDIYHYPRIAAALRETIRIMAEIDEVIEEHGGWPLQ